MVKEIQIESAKYGYGEGHIDFVVDEKKYVTAMIKWRGIEPVLIEKNICVRLKYGDLTKKCLEKWGFISSEELIDRKVEFDEKELKESLEGNNWIFAKSMPESPHWYALRKDWQGNRSFDDVAQYIRDNGFEEFYKYRAYRVLQVGDYNYWTMGDPLSVTILINKRKAYLKGVKC